MTALMSHGPLSICAGRARFSRPLTIFAARNVCRSIFSSTLVRGSSGWAPSRSICVKLEMPVSGVLTSWATPAASRPIDAIFSEICSCSSSWTLVEMSSTMTIVPVIASCASRSGVAATLTSSAARAVVPRRQRHAVIGRPLGGLDGAGAEHLDNRTVEQLVERAADGVLVPHAVELFQLAVPADDSAVAIEHRQPVVQRLENVLAELTHAIDLVGLGPQLAIEPAVFERRRRLRRHRRQEVPCLHC